MFYDGFLVAKFNGKEVKTMKKLIALITAMVFVLGTTVPAGAVWGVDVTRVLSAEADLATGVDNLYVMPMPQLKDTATGANVAGSKITWTYQGGKTWKVANQYLEISYQANLPGWGIQIYTNNKNGNPQWVEKPADPDGVKADKPGGLVGEGSVNYISIPLTWKAFPGGDYGKPTYSDGSGFSADTEYKTRYTEPKEKGFGDPATDDYYIELYQLKTGSGADEKLYGKYCWLADKGQQKWVDTDNDGKVDTGEIVSDYSNGADINTVVNYLGSSTCTYDAGGVFIYRDACASPIYLVLAAKIAVGSIKAKYSTNTLTLELYHE